MSQTNQRKYERFPTDALIWWDRDWEEEPIALLDISSGGMLCEFPTQLELGFKVSLHFDFPAHEGLIQCNCEVAHIRPGVGNFFLVGLKLESLDGMSKQDFMDRLSRGLPHNPPISEKS